MSDNNDESTGLAKAGKTNPSSQIQKERQRPTAATGESAAERDGKPTQPSDPDKRGKDGRGPGSGGNPKDSDRKGSATRNPQKHRQPAKRPAHKRPDSNRQTGGSDRNSSHGGGESKPTLRQPPVDRDELQSKAWELYHTDINEEGTSMFNEEEAEDLVRRSFILADIFLRFRDRLYATEPVTGASKPAGEPRQQP